MPREPRYPLHFQKSLNLEYTKVTTLDALRGLNLEVVAVDTDSMAGPVPSSNEKALTGLEPLRSMKTLKEIHYPVVQKNSMRRFEPLPSVEVVPDYN